MRFQAIASGSNGNCIFIESGSTRVLVDCGVSCKRITDGLKALSVSPDTISAVLITHEHSDHICGLKVFAKHYNTPVYGTRRTLTEIAEGDVKAEIDPALYRAVTPGETVTIGAFSVHVIHTYHDAADPVAYRFDAPEGKVAVMTDLGHYTEEIAEELKGLNGILLESNHDIRMLEVGHYPYALKRRILGDYGHLSNETSGKLLCKILNPELKFILLGHLSEENNYPDIALMSVKSEIDQSDVPFTSEDFRIEVAGRYESSSVFEL